MRQHKKFKIKLPHLVNVERHEKKCNKQKLLVMLKKIYP